MIYPKFLKEKSTIGVPAPSAGDMEEKRMNKGKNAIKYFKKLGYDLVLSKNMFNDINGRSAGRIDRAKEINDMFKNKSIDFIMCLAGGDFLLEMLPYVDFELLKNNPKFVAGFSDPTGLLYPMTTKYDIATLYGQNFQYFGSDKLHKCQEDFLNIATEKVLEEESYDLYEDESSEKITGLEPYNLTKKVYWKTLDGKDVNIKGRIIGGCFDIISELAGTKYDGISSFNEKYKDDGIIWYFDNCEKSMEDVIRILWKFNELNYFKYTKGIIFGRFGVNSTYYNYEINSCLKDSVLNEYDFPIIYDADISHKAPCLTIINGSIARIKVKDGKGKIRFELD